jgi:hypothetical protein
MRMGDRLQPCVWTPSIMARSYGTVVGQIKAITWALVKRFAFDPAIHTISTMMARDRPDGGLV